MGCGGGDRACGGVAAGEVLVAETHDDRLVRVDLTFGAASAEGRGYEEGGQWRFTLGPQEK